MPTTILGTGFVTGANRVTNEMVSRITDTSDAWIRERSGIEQRYYVEAGTGTSDLAVPAAEKAIADAGMTKDDIDYIVFATMTPDYYFPGCGSLLQTKLGMKHVPALDIRQQCSGFIYGLQVCDALITAGVAKNILFVGAEIHSGFMPWTDAMVDYMLGRTEQKPDPKDVEFGSKFRNLTVLFGDAAGALVLSKREGASGILGIRCHADGEKAESLFVPAVGMKYRPYVNAEQVAQGRYVPSMDGKTVFRAAVERMPEVVREVCDAQGVQIGDIDLLLAHQANLRICEAVQKQLKLPDSKVYNNIQKYGNTTAATIPIALDECRKSGRIKKGDLVCFVGLGAGFHWGAGLWRA